MGRNFGDFHVISITILCLMMFILPFLTDNPLILVGVLIIILSAYGAGAEFKKLLHSLKLFVPLFLLTFLIDALFAEQGMTVLFELWGKSFTLQGAVNSLLLSFKLLLVVLVFSALDMMADSDRAAAYFSSIAPKSTLMVMIGIKLIPNMRRRFRSLIEIYSIRGVDYGSKGLKERIKSYVPVLSVLLQDSLEGAFDIGEAAYVRGFLSGGRSVYDRQRWKARDTVLMLCCGAVACAFLAFKLSGSDRFDPYAALYAYGCINIGALVVFLSLMTDALVVFFVGEG